MRQGIAKATVRVAEVVGGQGELLGLPILGGLLGAGYGWVFEAITGEKDMIPGGLALGGANLVWCLPLALILAITFTCMAGTRATPARG